MESSWIPVQFNSEAMQLSVTRHQTIDAAEARRQRREDAPGTMADTMTRPPSAESTTRVKHLSARR